MALQEEGTDGAALVFAFFVRRPVHVGTVPSEGPTVVGIILGAALLVGVLTYLPVLALGPIVEQFMARR